MRPAFLTLLVTSILLAQSGCGTVCNLAGGVIDPEKEPRVYGGVQRDIEFWQDYQGGGGSGLHGSGSQGYGLLILLGVIVGDPLLSFIGDTLTLPITAYAQQKRVAAETRNSWTTSTPPAEPPVNPPQ